MRVSNKLFLMSVYLGTFPQVFTVIKFISINGARSCTLCLTMRCGTMAIGNICYVKSEHYRKTFKNRLNR